MPDVDLTRSDPPGRPACPDRRARGRGARAVGPRPGARDRAGIGSGCVRGRDRGGDGHPDARAAGLAARDRPRPRRPAHPRTPGRRPGGRPPGPVPPVRGLRRRARDPADAPVPAPRGPSRRAHQRRRRREPGLRRRHADGHRGPPQPDRQVAPAGTQCRRPRRPVPGPHRRLVARPPGSPPGGWAGGGRAARGGDLRRAARAALRDARGGSDAEDAGRATRSGCPRWSRRSRRAGWGSRSAASRW